MTPIEMLYAVSLLIIKLFMGLFALAVALVIFIVAREVAYTLREQNKKKLEEKEHEDESV